MYGGPLDGHIESINPRARKGDVRNFGKLVEFNIKRREQTFPHMPQIRYQYNGEKFVYIGESN